jgi:hypothetical protein
MLQPTALEIFTQDRSSVFLNFSSKAQFETTPSPRFEAPVICTVDKTIRFGGETTSKLVTFSLTSWYCSTYLNIALEWTRAGGVERHFRLAV